MCSAHGLCETWLVFVTDDFGVGHIFPASGGMRIIPSDSALHKIIEVFRGGHDDAGCHALKLELGYEAPERSTCPVAASHDAQWLAEPCNMAPGFAPPAWKILTRQVNGTSYLFPHEGHFLKEPSAEMLRASIKAASDVAKSSDNAGPIVRALEREFVSSETLVVVRGGLMARARAFEPWPFQTWRIDVSKDGDMPIFSVPPRGMPRPPTIDELSKALDVFASPTDEKVLAFEKELLAVPT